MSVSCSQAYERILERLDSTADVELGEHYLDETNFGNFVIEYARYGRKFGFLNDRGQLFSCVGPGFEQCEMIVDGLGEAELTVFLEAVQSKIGG